jgi:hypothetical protein
MSAWLNTLSPSTFLLLLLMVYVAAGAAAWYALVWLVTAKWGRLALAAIAIHALVFVSVEGATRFVRWHSKITNQSADARERPSTAPEPASTFPEINAHN